MLEKIKEYFNIEKMKTVFGELSTLQKVIFGLFILFAIGLLVFSFDLSVSNEKVYLFKKPLSTEDYAKITSELEKMQVPFSTLEDKYIVLENEATSTRIRMKLAQNNLLPEGIKGWELFDMDSWTSTEFDKDVKLRRAIEGEMKRHIQSLDWVEETEVSISVPKKSLYTERENDVKAAVSLRPAEGYYDYLKNKKVIKGIENILVNGIDGLVLENVTITDQNGNELNNFAEDDYKENIKQAIEENKIKEREVKKIKKKVEESLRGIFAEDRYRVAVDIDINFDKKVVDTKEILPVIIKKRTPGLPYDDSVVKETIPVSQKELKERFEGQGFIPEGPPGQEANLPPGYKESLDGRNKYSKDEVVNNYVNGEQVTKKVYDAMEVVKKSVSVTVDGVWQKLYNKDGEYILENNAKIKRKYTPVSQEELFKIEAFVKGAINYDVKRGDIVTVKSFAFDRSKQFSAEDSSYIKIQKAKQFILFFVVTILLFFGLFLGYRFFKNELDRRRRLKEEEAELMRRLQREEALNDFAQADMAKEIMTQEDKEIIRLQDEINTVVDSKPEEVAKVISTWIISNK